MRLWKNTGFFIFILSDQLVNLHSDYRMTSYSTFECNNLSYCGELLMTATMWERCLGSKNQKNKKNPTFLLAPYSIPSTVKCRGGLHAWGLPAGLTTSIKLYRWIHQSHEKQHRACLKHVQQNPATRPNGGSEGPNNLITTYLISKDKMDQILGQVQSGSVKLCC